MSADVYLAKSHLWLHEKLLERAVLGNQVARITESRKQADVIIYLDPPWPDPKAPDRLASFRGRDFGRMCVYSQADVPLAWAPGMYCSLEASRALSGQTGGFYVSHHHRRLDSGFFAGLEAVRDIEKDLLWSFMGTLSNHPVRQRLSQVSDSDSLVRDTQHFSDVVRWGWDSTHSEEGRAAFSDYANLLGRSSFVLCPRGVGASTIRIFEAIQVGRCPVIVSDDWLAPPFVDWDRCSIRVPEARIAELPTILRSREPESQALGREARLVWERFFSPESQLATLVRGCLAIDEDIGTRARMELFMHMLADPKSLRRITGQGRRLVRDRRHRHR
jgi:Exostosin family